MDLLQIQLKSMIVVFSGGCILEPPQELKNIEAWASPQANLTRVSGEYNVY